jgi:hypothetical protein
MSRKPVMDKHKRKVLDLLEFCGELCPSLRVCQILGNAIPADRLVANGHDTYYITDEELAGWLQDYANLLLSLGRD